MRAASSLLAAAVTLAAAGAAVAFPQSTHPAMTDPSKATEKAPEKFRAKFETTKGDVVFECTREWAPNGVDRFYNLVKIGFFDDVAFFRVKSDFVAQWGIHGDPKVSAAWRDANLPPDPVKQSNTRGRLTYAMAGRPDTRSTQVFVNYKDNANLDGMGFAPICEVVEGMEIADKLNGEYGERVTSKQGEIHMKGNAYLKEAWPNLDYIKTATVVGEAPNTQKADKPATPMEEGSSKAIWIVGAIVVGGLAIMLFTNNKQPEKSPAPPPKPAPKPAASAEPKAGAPKKKKKKRPAAEG